MAKAASEAGKSQVGRTSSEFTAGATIPKGAVDETTDSHIISLVEKQPYFAGPAGSLTGVDVKDMPRMKRLSIRRLLLAPRGVREPHWHVDAHELGFCLRGEHLVTIAGNHSTRDSFIISPVRCSLFRRGLSITSKTSALEKVKSFLPFPMNG
jgi:oxalate decarboxylase